jgi:hypothetical protein
MLSVSESSSHSDEVSFHLLVIRLVLGVLTVCLAVDSASEIISKEELEVSVGATLPLDMATS